MILYQTPPLFSPIGNPILFRFSCEHSNETYLFATIINRETNRDIVQPCPGQYSDLGIANTLKTLSKPSVYDFLNNKQIFPIKNSIISYQICYSKYNASPITTEPFFTFPNTLSNTQLYVYQQKNTSFYAELLSKKFFFTYLPKKTTLYYTQKQWLTFFCQKNKNITLQLTIITQKGSTKTVNIPFKTDEYEPFLYAINVSPISIQYQLDFGDKPQSYTVKVLDESSNAITETFSFAVKDTPSKDYHFYYKNSFGCYETIVLFNKKRAIDYERSSYSQLIQKTQQATASENFTVQTEQTSDKNYINYLNEFLLSKEVFLKEQDILIPIELSQNQIVPLEDYQCSKSIAIEFKTTPENVHFSLDNLKTKRRFSNQFAKQFS